MFNKSLIFSVALSSVVTLSSAVFAECKVSVAFPTNVSIVSEDQKNSLLDVLANAPEATQIDLTGFADAIGTAESNQALSERRVQSVANFLRASGYAGNIAKLTAYGETNLPVKTLAADVRNRVVTIYIEQCTSPLVDELALARPLLAAAGLGAVLGILGGTDGITTTTTTTTTDEPDTTTTTTTTPETPTTTTTTTPSTTTTTTTTATTTTTTTN